MQFGFSPGRGTTDAMFVLRQVQEKVLERGRRLYFAFLDLEKAYDRVPREVVYWCLRRRGVPERLINMVRATYCDVTTSVRTQSGTTGKFDIKVGLHQGSALSPFLFITIMDTLTEAGRTEVPWELIFADDIALVAETEEELQAKVLEWQESLKRGGLKMNPDKSEVLVTERDGNQELRILDTSGHTLKQVDRFKYLGTEITREGGSRKAVEQRVKAAWNKWREMTGVLCDKKIPRKLKCKIYTTVVRPVLLYGAECWAMCKADEDLLSRTEMRMLRWIIGVSRLDRIPNDEIRERCGVRDIRDKAREARLRWYGHVMRRDRDEAVKKVWDMQFQGRRPVGRPRKRWWDCIREDLTATGLHAEDAQDRARWRRGIRAADPGRVWENS